MGKVTSIQDARIFKQHGWPLNTTVEQRTFSREYSRRWFAMVNANVDWVTALLDYSNAISKRNWKRVGRAFEAFDRAVGRFADYHGETTDDGERVIIAAVGQQTLQPIVDYWDTICQALNDGEAIEIKARDLLIEGAA